MCKDPWDGDHSRVAYNAIGIFDSPWLRTAVTHLHGGYCDTDEAKVEDTW